METLSLNEQNIVSAIKQNLIFISENRILGNLDAEVLQFADTPLSSRKATFEDIPQILATQNTICVWKIPEGVF